MLACKQGAKGAEGEREFPTDSGLNTEPTAGHVLMALRS